MKVRNFHWNVESQNFHEMHEFFEELYNQSAGNIDEIAEKIRKFMNLVNMNSGSLDVILTPSGEYVFLEVNPVGQFWQVSYPCNYNLEKKVAEYLCNH